MAPKLLPFFNGSVVVAFLATMTLPFITRADDEAAFLDTSLTYDFNEECYLCYNDAEPDPEVPQDETLFLTSSGSPVTCNDWAAFMAGISGENLTNGRCLGYQFLSSYYCGCPEPPRPSCMLCQDGSEPGDLDGTVTFPDGEQQTCRAFVIFAIRESFGETINSGREVACRNWQESGVASCGCPVPEDSDCKTLCPNGESVPEPDLVIFNDGITCGEIERRLSVYEGGQCEAFQRTTGLSCGCEVDLSREFEEDLLNEIGLCRVCGDGRPLQNPSALTMSAGMEFTCAQVEVAVTRDPGRNCGVARGFQYEDCCQEYFPSESPSERPTASARPSGPTSAPSTQPSPPPPPSSRPTNAPSTKPSPLPSSRPTSAPSTKPSPLPSSQPLPSPTSAPTASPTAQPSAEDTSPPTPSPAALPSMGVTTPIATISPTIGETLAPTTEDTAEPTASYAPSDSMSPTAGGSSEAPTSETTTLAPTDASTTEPETVQPTVMESAPPSDQPTTPAVTNEPSEHRSTQIPPTTRPSPAPMFTSPTTTPSITPSTAPSTTPATTTPTTAPTVVSPTISPTAAPTVTPSSQPTSSDEATQRSVDSVQQTSDDGGGSAGLPPGVITLIVIGGVAAVVGTAYRVYTL